MQKSKIYKIFVAGIEFGIKHGPFPDASLLDLHTSLTNELHQDAKSVMWAVIIAGYNYGSNARGVQPTEEKMQFMFENLIEGKPLEDSRDSYYAIKQKIDKLLTGTGDGNS